MRKFTLFALLAVFVVSTMAIAQGASGKPVMPEAYTMKLISPAAGDKWEEGSTQSVTWNITPAMDPDSMIVVFMNVEGDQPPKEAVIGRILKSDPGKWVWEKVGPAGEKLLIEVRAFVGKSVAAKASQAFMIVPASKPPVKAAVAEPASEDNLKVTVNYPNGSEQWKQGTIETISWAFSSLPTGDSRLIDVYLSRDGGKSYSEVIAKDLPAFTTDCKMEVNGPAADKCLIKVALIDREGKFRPVFDVSDKVFQIHAPTMPPTGQAR